MAVGLGGETIWISPTNDNTGTSTAYDDLSGQGNNGQNFGSTLVSDTGSGGTYAMDFDGVSDFVATSYGPATWITTGVWTLSAWVNYGVVGDSLIAGGAIGPSNRAVSLVFDTFASSRGHGSVYSKGASPYGARAYAGDRDTVVPASSAKRCPASPTKKAPRLQ